MPSSDAHLPRIPKQQQEQQQQKWLKESQAGSHKSDVAGKNSVLNQTVFTDARQAAMLSQTAKTTTETTDTADTQSSNDTTVEKPPANATDGSNQADSTQQQSSSDKNTEGDAGKLVDDKGDEELTESRALAKKQHKKKPRITFHPEDKCRISSKPSNEEDTKEDDVIEDQKVESEQEDSSNKEEEVDKLSKQEVTSPTSSESSHAPSTTKGSSPGSQQQYTDTYQNSEFRPYNPLSHTVEEKLFPCPFGPANFFDYPSWPDKTECLNVVENLSSWVKSSRMDIDMTTRGHE